MRRLGALQLKRHREKLANTLFSTSTPNNANNTRHVEVCTNILVLGFLSILSLVSYSKNAADEARLTTTQRE